MDTYEEKYKAALERAKQFSEKPYLEDSAGIVEYIFPELASEDERIRKEIIDFAIKANNGVTSILANNYDFNSWLAWLEKQGEQALTIEMKSAEESLGIDSDTYNEIVDKCIYGEQKPADKVEPKFHEGEWVVNRFGDVWHIDSFDSKNYQVSNGDRHCYFPIEKQDEMHLWTIQDAKDSDVLATDKSVFIYAKVLYSKPYAYCGVDKFGVFKDNCLEHDWANSVDNIHPATKEQRDLLFQKMKEAGYEWDANKKEPKKIEQGNSPLLSNSSNIGKDEQKPSWSEEDIEMLNFAISFVEHSAFTTIGKGKNNVISWLKSLRDRVQPQPKQEWSEEDERLLSKLQTYVDLECFDRECNGQDLIDWLKSLKPRLQ